MKNIVCPRCKGEGTVTNPEVDGPGISQERFEEDPDFEEDYMSGVYDIICPECRGKRVTTRSDHHKYLKDEQERRADHFTMLHEQGIYPGSRDYF